MNREETLSHLVENHVEFTEYMQSLNEEDFMYALNGEKWTAGQELVHIISSVNKLAYALLLPKFILKMKFGVANRPSRTYDAQVNKYTKGLEALAGSYKVKLDPVPYDKRDLLIEKLEKSITSLCSRAGKYSEENLDYYILPHPLMGKMTMRELLYFTAHHVLHHKANSVRNLKRAKKL
ncbi:MAG: DinB family protein [Bacteroidetes bacterium]|nr:MAG: DinB family protein [Bacteroidota bacterium]